MSERKTLVLFSGGRDSSAATVEMAQSGYKVLLFTYQAGMSELTGYLGDSAPDIRHKELLKVFPDYISRDRVIKGNTYLIRKLAIEKTNHTHVVYPLALALAVHAEAVVYCLKNGIKHITCGYSGYQAKEERYIEQREDFFERMKDFVGEYDILYHVPVIEKSKKEVMDILEMHGISSNSLENKSLFGGIYFDADKALDYWNGSLSATKEYITQHQ